jgi:hypothetical protein
LKYKKDDIFDIDDAGISSYEIAKISNYFDILNFFGFFNYSK